KYSIAWLKRYIDNDTRYEQFLCPPPGVTAISDYRHTCPGS
ncbi:alpha/beta hydrolase, partial [Actinomadura sp. DSM 109109]|nr:alpha/beta hydrolase [Actinomadura lepetitiana]